MSQRRLVTRTLGFLAGGFALARPAAAHAGTTHAGTPHWILFVLFLGGVAAVALASFAVRRDLVAVRPAIATAIGGAVAAILGGIGLVELQVVGDAAPSLVAYYPLASLLVGGALALGGFLAVARRWPHRPQYAVLCLVLAWWIVYPTVMPNGGYYHPLGYVLAASLPVTLGYVVWTDARAVLQSLRLSRKPTAVGVAAALLFVVFFAFSAGTVTVNPDEGLGGPTEAFVIPYKVASPLVVWPAVEFYIPSVPFGGYVSVGTLLLMGTLGGLVGLNAAVVTQQWATETAVAGTKTFTGTLAASGATACCCCAPAFYGALSVVLGAAATPVYWSFMVPTSPVGGAFFAGSVLLLTASLLQATGASDVTSTAPDAQPE